MTSARPGAALALLASTQLLLIMDTAIVNVALPSVGDDLGSGSAGLSWVANAYLIAFGGLLLLGGAWPICSATGCSTSAVWDCLPPPPRRAGSPGRRAP